MQTKEIASFLSQTDPFHGFLPVSEVSSGLTMREQRAAVCEASAALQGTRARPRLIVSLTFVKGKSKKSPQVPGKCLMSNHFSGINHPNPHMI